MLERVRLEEIARQVRSGMMPTEVVGFFVGERGPVVDLDELAEAVDRPEPPEPPHSETLSPPEAPIDPTTT